MLQSRNRKSRRTYDKEYLSVPAVYCPQGAGMNFSTRSFFLPDFSRRSPPLQNRMCLHRGAGRRRRRRRKAPACPGRWGLALGFPSTAAFSLFITRFSHMTQIYSPPPSPRVYSHCGDLRPRTTCHFFFFAVMVVVGGGGCWFGGHYTAAASRRRQQKKKKRETKATGGTRPRASLATIRHIVLFSCYANETSQHVGN